MLIYIAVGCREVNQELYSMVYVAEIVVLVHHGPEALWYNQCL